MSESSQTDKANAKSENQITENELDAAKLKASNERLLKESMEWKAKAKALAAEKEEIEAKKLAESGDKDAQLEAERKKAKAALDALAKTNKKVVGQAVKDKISKYAGDVYNVDELLNRPKLKEFLKEGLDEEKLDFSDDVAKKYIEEVKKEAPYLWKTQGPMGVKTSRATSTGTSSTVDTSKMTGAELREYIKQNFS
jgi:hypothetical protein